ncbi:MAG: hypothetical protein AAFR52_13805 [Pseudomonadota bacterium]
MRLTATMIQSLRRFAKDDGGTATIEILLWVPLMAELMLITVDVSQAYARHGEMWSAAYDATRQVANGRFDDDVAIDRPMEAVVRAHVHEMLGPGYGVTYAEVGRFHVTEVRSDVASMSFFGTLTAVLGDVRATITMVDEP